MAKVSKLWHFYHVADAKQYLLLEDMRQKYGDIVRTGPNELTLFCPEAYKPINAYGSRCTKSAWYDMLAPFTAMNTTRSKPEHDKRRRAYENGLSVKAVRGYHDRVLRIAKELDRSLEQRVGQPVDVTTWMQYFAFDIMGEIGFGKSFEQAATGRSHFETEFLRHGMTMLAWVTPIPWLYHLGLALPAIPGFTKNWLDLLAWSVDQAKLKLEIMSHVIDYWRGQDEGKRDMNDLGGDSIAVVIAGSQTVAASLIFATYRLAKHPDWVAKIYNEITQTESRDPVTLQTMPLLNAFINETLRLHPPVPSAGLRNTPTEGVMVGERFIPGDVTVLVPNYSLGRLESCFERPEEFLPERWCTEPSLVKDKGAFRPFGLGPYGCVGKHLALLEIRVVLTEIVDKYTIEFAPDEDCSIMFGQLQDVFTAGPGKCDLVFSLRDKSS
ncbi:MAG: hypothetical protein L6R41_007075 [Letrouitia leprolyta]|nr:MAG: hypothetical protein L6R41_007075 [Letrouitia leprolyta]